MTYIQTTEFLTNEIKYYSGNKGRINKTNIVRLFLKTGHPSCAWISAAL